MGNSQPLRLRTAVCLSLILLLAASLRLTDLVRCAYMLDEDWSVEIATGRGSVHQHVPVNQIISPPPFYSLTDAPPWWHIWSHMQVTHPPLYSLLLRAWEELVGDTDYSGRLFSVIASLIAIAALFDTVRLQASLTPAFWAALLMTLASPQVEHARLTRSYTLLLAVALIAVNLVVRIETFGITRRRLILLAISILATLMTHYFCIGAIAGLLIYCCLFARSHRRPLTTTLILASLIFTIVWLPWMWQQRHLFATDDPATLFLTTGSTHHTRTTILRLLLNPARMLITITEGGPAQIVCIIAGVLLCVAPLLPMVYRKNRWLLLWGLWLGGSLSVVTLLDLSRGTDHLHYIRYTLLASPAVYALIPMLCTQLPKRPALLTHLISGAVAIISVIVLPDVYHYDNVDPRVIARDFIARPGPNDLLVFAAAPADLAKCEIELFMLTRYMQPMTCPVLILTRPAGPEIMAAAGKSRLIFLDSQSADYDTYFPGARLIKGRTYRRLGNLFTLQAGSKN